MIKESYDFQSDRTVYVEWNDHPILWCPNCLGSRHVVMETPKYMEAYWAPCPCCNQLFEAHP